jgi:hypothetical protein
MINRNFSSLRTAVSFLRSEGFKPVTSTPRTWKKVEGHQVREVRLHTFGNGLRSKVMEVRDES